MNIHKSNRSVSFTNRHKGGEKIRKQAIIFILTITFALIICGAVSAKPYTTSYTDVYVSTTGNDSYDGGDPLHPAQTIRHALEVTKENGSTVHIANGVYSGTNNTRVKITKNMTIAGQSKTGTIINGSDTNWIFEIEDDITVTIKNLTFANGTANEGSAIYNDGNTTIIDCIFTGNHAYSDGGAIHDEDLLTIINSAFKNNSANNGGAIYDCCGTEIVKGCTFTGNTAVNDGGAFYVEENATITGCTFTGNHANDDGGALYNENDLTVTGCTFTNNSADEDGGAIYNYYSDMTVNYCRIVGNSADGVGDAVCSGHGGEMQPMAVESPREYSADARYNWWGSNNPDFDSLISGDVDYTPWLYMTLTANPITIKNCETSLITASFNNLFNGEIRTDLDPTVGHIPDGSPVNFQTDLGTIGCKSIDKTTTGGIATAMLTASELAGIAHVNATADSQTLFVNVTITPKAGLYLTVTPSKINPVPGDTVVYTLKVGNNGPDAAKDVVMTYVVPEGLEFAGAKVDVGTYSYDPATRTITWIIGDVPVGDPYMWLSLHVAKSGHYLINPTLSTSSYDPTIDTQSVTVNAAAKTTVKAASNTIPLQKTGLPLAGLVLAILAVFSGLVPKRK